MLSNGFSQYFKKRIKDKRFIFIITIYIAFCLFSAILFCINCRIRDSLLSLGFVLFAVLVFPIEYFFGLRMGDLFLSVALFIAAGSILGSGYDFYTIFPWHDTLLHGISGFVFAAFGTAICVRLFQNKEERTSFCGKIIFGFCFSLAIACVWEIFEYICTLLFGFDMMEDTIVRDISSYFLAGTHAEAININGIIQTVIYYGDGSTYVIDGYLDIGLIDTLSDMIICFIGSAAFVILSIISNFKFPRINDMLIPQIIDSRDEAVKQLV